MRVAYAEANETCRLVGDARTEPAFDLKSPQLHIRMEAGGWSIGRIPAADAGLLRVFDRAGNATEKDLSDLGIGAVKPE